MYNSLLVAYYPDIQYPIPQESQLRIRESRTGNSIVLEFIQGVMQVWEMGSPTLQITGIVGITAAMSRIIIGFSRGFVEFRKTWHEGTKAKYDAEKMRHESKKASLEIEELKAKEGMEDQRVPEDRELSQIPKEAQQAASIAAFEFLHSLEYAPNITRVRVNGTEVINKGSSDASVSEIG